MITEQKLLDMVNALDSIEVHQDHWPGGRGLGAARGSDISRAASHGVFATLSRLAKFSRI